MSASNVSEPSHFILRFRGEGDPSPRDLERIHRQPGLVVLDESMRRMLLVATTPPSLEAILEALPSWAASPEQTLTLPNPRKKIRKKA